MQISRYAAIGGLSLLAIMNWLATLTGELPAEYLKAPELPKSTAATPPAQEGV